MISSSFIILFFARWLAWIVLGGAVIFLAIEKKKHPRRIFTEVLATAITVASAWGISAIIKNITHIARPFVSTGTSPHFFVDGQASFPSGHATVFFALATIIYLYDKTMGACFYVLAFVIAISRVLVGVHYSIDVIAGAVIGIGVAWVVYRLLSKLLRPLVKIN